MFDIGNLGGGRHCVSMEGILILRLQIFLLAPCWAPSKSQAYEALEAQSI